MKTLTKGILCTAPSKYTLNGKFSGTQTLVCDGGFFPAICSTLPVLAANALIEGRVMTAKDREAEARLSNFQAATCHSRSALELIRSERLFLRVYHTSLLFMQKTLCSLIRAVLSRSKTIQPDLIL